MTMKLQLNYDKQEEHYTYYEQTWFVEYKMMIGH